MKDRVRISKAEFTCYGGLSNPFCFRIMRSGVWTYWRRT